jgi:hypothetical protein
LKTLDKHLEGKAGGQAGHAFIDAGVVAVLLVALGLGVGVFQVLAVINTHLGEKTRVLRLLDPGQDGKLGHHAQGVGGARSLGQGAVGEELVVDADLVGHAQAVGHLDGVDPVEKGLVIAVVAEGDPFGLIGVGHYDAVKRNRAETFRALVVAFLGRGEERVQDLDGRLEHLDELKQTPVGQAQAAGVGVGIRVILGELLEHPDVDLADQGRDVLVVLVARLGLGYGDLAQYRGAQLDDTEAGYVAVELVQALDRPRAHDGVEVAPGDSVVVLEDGAVLVGAEEA